MDVEKGGCSKIMSLKILPRKKGTDDICWCKVQDNIKHIIATSVVVGFLGLVLFCMLVGGMKTAYEVGITSWDSAFAYAVGFWIIMGVTILVTIIICWLIFSLLYWLCTTVWRVFWSIVSHGDTDKNCKF
jgi:uncharacterized BrkB/YihY/UPF0761 family membrane protein